MRKNGFWYGYLEAGDKGSAVLLDPEIDSGSKKTMMLYNLNRNQIIEYTRDIVAPKLRELKTSEATLISALESAYAAARKNYTGTRNKRLSDIPDSGPPPRASDEDNVDDFDDFDEDALEDESIEDEDGEEN